MANLELNVSRVEAQPNEKFVPKSDEESASLHLRMEACAITNREMPENERYLWSEDFAADFAKKAEKDHHFTGAIAKDLKEHGATVERIASVPEYKSIGKNLNQTDKVKITFPEACKGDPLSNLQVEIVPLANGTNVSFKSLVKSPGINSQKPLEESKITVTVREGKATQSIIESADGSIKTLRIGKDGKLDSLQNNRKDGSKDFVKYDGKQERGKEIPILEIYEPADGTRQIKHFDKGRPTEKVIVDASDKLISYNAYDEKGKELPVYDVRSLTGRALYLAHLRKKE